LALGSAGMPWSSSNLSQGSRSIWSVVNTMPRPCSVVRFWRVTATFPTCGDNDLFGSVAHGVAWPEVREGSILRHIQPINRPLVPAEDIVASVVRITRLGAPAHKAMHRNAAAPGGCHSSASARNALRIIRARVIATVKPLFCTSLWGSRSFRGPKRRRQVEDPRMIQRPASTMRSTPSRSSARSTATMGSRRQAATMGVAFSRVAFSRSRNSSSSAWKVPRSATFGLQVHLSQEGSSFSPLASPLRREHRDSRLAPRTSGKMASAAA
jgi:hypothetical protein